MNWPEAFAIVGIAISITICFCNLLKLGYTDPPVPTEWHHVKTPDKEYWTSSWATPVEEKSGPNGPKEI